MAFDPQLGIAEETTPGTVATPTRFYEFGNEAVKQEIERIKYLGLRPNRKVHGTSNVVPGKKGSAGDIELPVMNKGMALWFKHCLGAVATTTPTGATLTRDHKCTVGVLDGKSLTVQFGRPTVSGTVEDFTYAGCKVNTWGLSHDTDSQLMLNVSLDGISESAAVALASASYPTALTPFAYTAGAITVDGSAFDVKDWNLEGNNNLATDRYFIRATTPEQKKEQLEGGGIREYTGTINTEFMDRTNYDKFVSGAFASFSAVYTGALIEGAFNYTVTVTLPNIQFNGETPNVGGFEIVQQALPFEVFDGGTADGPVVITVRNSDTAA